MRIGFWTPERLKELERLWPHKTPAQLAAHFERPSQVCEEAYRFITQHKKLKIASYKRGKTRITIYAAAYAEGAVCHPTTHNDPANE